MAAVTQRAAGAQASVLNASGYVTARREATVSSKITGKVVQVNVEEGMAVTEGQVLARLDDASVRAQLALAQAQVVAAEHGVTENQIHEKQARITLDRATKLLASGAGPETDVEQAKLDVDTTEARISLLEGAGQGGRGPGRRRADRAGQHVIRAPFSGIAISKDAQPGEMVSPVSAGGGFTRTGICTVVDMKSLEIDVDVNESYISRVKPDQDVTAVLDAYPEWQIPAHVSSPRADRRPAEGHRAGADRVQGARPEDPPRYGREGDVPQGAGRANLESAAGGRACRRRSCPRRRSRPRATRRSCSS